MTAMWWSFAALALVAIAFIAFPWVFGKRELVVNDGEDKANVQLYREHLGDLQQQFERCEINQQQFDQLKFELERSLLVDNSEVAVESSMNPMVKPWLLVVLAALLLVVSTAMYRSLGASQDLEILQLLEDSAQSQVFDNPELLEQKRSETLAKIDQRLKQDPDNYFYWTLSARLHSAAEEYNEALQAYRRALMMSPDDVTLLEEMLQASYMSTSGKFSPELRDIIDRILQLKPNNLPVTGLSARLAMESGNYSLAIEQYQAVLKALPAENDTAKSIRADIEFAQRALVESGQSNRVDALSDAESASGETSGPALQISISLADGLTANQGATLFVIARKPNVQGPPLAVKRLTLTTLPIDVRLDDSNTMLPGTSLSDVASLELIVRISQSGSPIKQPGDLQGRAQVDTPSGDLVVDMTIDEVVK
jgi:cytochrome c-type biogenesis protein CcmH